MGINFNQISACIIYWIVKIGQIIVTHIISNKHSGPGTLGSNETNQITNWNYLHNMLVHSFFFYYILSFRLSFCIFRYDYRLKHTCDFFFICLNSMFWFYYDVYFLSFFPRRLFYQTFPHPGPNFMCTTFSESILNLIGWSFFDFRCSFLNG